MCGVETNGSLVRVSPGTVPTPPLSAVPCSLLWRVGWEGWSGTTFGWVSGSSYPHLPEPSTRRRRSFGGPGLGDGVCPFVIVQAKDPDKGPPTVPPQTPKGAESLV